MYENSEILLNVITSITTLKGHYIGSLFIDFTDLLLIILYTKNNDHDKFVFVKSLLMSCYFWMYKRIISIIDSLIDILNGQYE